MPRMSKNTEKVSTHARPMMCTMNLRLLHAKRDRKGEQYEPLTNMNDRAVHKFLLSLIYGQKSQKSHKLLQS